jgi:hypothetical protein
MFVADNGDRRSNGHRVKVASVFHGPRPEVEPDFMHPA